MSKSKPVTPAAPTRKQLSRAERDRQMQSYIRISAVIVGVLLVGILGYGLIDLNVLQPRQPAALVNGETVTIGEWQKAVRYRRYQLVSQYLQIQNTIQAFGGDPQFTQYFQNQVQQIQLQLSDPTALGRTVLNELVEDRLIRQEAKTRNITVSAEELEDRYRQFFGYFPNGTEIPTSTPTELPTYVAPTVNPTVIARWTPTATLTPTATITPTATSTPGPSPTTEPTGTPEPTATPVSTEAFATRVANYNADVRQAANLTDADIRHFLENELYREKVAEAIAKDVPASDEQVHARHILVADEETAKKVQERLQAGEAWDALAAEFSTDQSNATHGGDLGWFGAGRMVAEFETAAFAAAVGTISEPVKTQFGYHLIQVLGKEQRPLSADQIEQKKSDAFQKWLDEKRQAVDAGGKPLVEIITGWENYVPQSPSLPAGAGG